MSALTAEICAEIEDLRAWLKEHPELVSVGVTASTVRALLAIFPPPAATSSDPRVTMNSGDLDWLESHVVDARRPDAGTNRKQIVGSLLLEMAGDLIAQARAATSSEQPERDALIAVYEAARVFCSAELDDIEAAEDELQRVVALAEPTDVEVKS